MSEESNGFPMRTLVLCLILVPVIWYLVSFAIKKNKESDSRARQCQLDCAQQGHPGYNFKWNVLSGPVCECLEGN